MGNCSQNPVPELWSSQPKLMKLSEIKQILADGRIQLTKSLGQNFLHDRNQLLRIIEAAELTSSDRLLEIGPGLGPLTSQLLRTGAEVLAIEKDGRLIGFLEKHFQNAPNLTLVHDDALDYLRRKPRDWSGWKLVANLPYSVASPILVELALGENCPERLVATLQLEVAQRIVSSPGTREYGLLTLLLQLRYQPQGWFKIPPGCFFPEPEIDSACVKLVKRSKEPLTPPQRSLFVRIVKQAFSQRRKMMLKLLKANWPAPALDLAWKQLDLSPQIRAEKVSVDQFVQLTQSLWSCSHPSPAHD
jgi:16S rRNA (adenine1518-N6/adenine1519-N6)-dimethyltransferase